VQLLPDDRTTRGDWFLGYGVERHVLCAQNYRFDREGGPASGFAVRFSTTDPKEPGRLWVSAKRTDDPAALWDPARRLRLPANRDDRGEQYPLGQGPDLLLDCAMPAGEHVLSLYFVNDHHYYEPNRRYTIEIRENGGLLLLADVRDFGGGVYKRFRVEGPRELQVRMRRDASLNVILQGVFLEPVYRQRPLPRVAGIRPAASAVAPLWRRCEALRAEGRWREAEAVFAEFAKTVPPDDIGQVLAALAADDPPGFAVPDGRGRLYPLGRHPLDRLWERLLGRPGGLSTAELAAAIRSEGPCVTPQARLRALAALETGAGKEGTPIDLELRVVAARRLLACGGDREAADILRRCLAQPGRADLRHEAAVGLLKLADRTATSAAEVQAVWKDCDSVLADAGVDVRDAAVLHAATAFAATGDPVAALAMLQRHSRPAAWQGLAQAWDKQAKAKDADGATP
jgi:hypothetical protein